MLSAAMQTSDTFSVPRSLQPPIVWLWLCKLARIELSGTGQLGDSGVILLVKESCAALFRAIYTHCLADRQGLFMPTWHGEETRRDYAAYLKNKYDALIVIPADDAEGRARVRDALRLARTAGVLIFPAGIGVAPQVVLPGETRTALPLPGARVKLVIEAPFKTAEHPEQIPASWHRAVVNLLERADEQAHHVLGQSPTSPE
jgi:lysophospholipid acyltransferase (LPLAT)-like uncharacterized protein